ncbi:MAG: hypothetical protein IKP10_06375 [Clostridia bacterium]|nr:hypothetical protein [Clostridia bacterium]
MKKTCIWLLAALMLAGVCLPASAASLVGGNGNGVSGIPQRVSPYAWAAQYGNLSLPDALDDNSATWWSFLISDGTASDGTPEASFYFSGAEVSAVWLRAGCYQSVSEYFSHAFPTLVRLRFYSNSGYVDYSYQLEDMYDMISSSDSWANGYQSLRLPSPVYGVTRIELYVSQWRGGTVYPNDLCISDVAFSGQDGSSVAPSPGGQTGGNGINTTLKMRLATRSGPSTRYTELGSYFQEGSPVRVLTKAYDYSNGIWWVQVEFTYLGTQRRAYTGLKRVNVDISRVPEEKQTGSATVSRDATAYYGPGTAYTRYKTAIPAWTTGTVWNRENGYVQFEYVNSAGTKVRVWLSSNDVNLY